MGNRLMHRHHIVPRHMGGENDPLNLETVTIQDHAQRHYDLWLMCGLEEDLIAYRMLSGQITAEEATRQAVIQSNKRCHKGLGLHRTDIQKKRISKARSGKGAGSRNAMANPEHRAKVAASKVGRKKVLQPDGKYKMVYP
jgi:hypothetical protein